MPYNWRARPSAPYLGAGQFRFGRFCAIRGNNVTVVAVSLHRLPTRFTDHALESFDRLLLRRGCTRHVENFFFHDRAVQVVHPITEGDLCKRQSHAHPISGEMIDVIEINAADGKIVKLLKCRGRLDVCEHGGLRFEGEWDKSGETAGLILQLAQLAQVIDALSESFDMSVEHGASAAAPHGVPGGMDIEPFRGSLLTATNFISHRGIENFRAAAGHGSEAGVAQKLKCVADGHAKNSLCQMAHLDGRERLDVQIWIKRAQAAQEIEVPILFQCRMQTTNHVHFSNPEAACFSDSADDVVNGSLEGMGIAFFGGEGAELAGENANIGVIDVAIQDIGRVVAILLFAERICDNSEGVKIVRAVEIESIGFRNALPGLNFCGDWPKFFWNKQEVHLRRAIMHARLRRCNNNNDE